MRMDESAATREELLGELRKALSINAVRDAYKAAAPLWLENADRVLERAVAEQYPFGYSLGQMDIDAFYNLREWLREAIVAKGAKPDGSGVGMGQADISFDLDGAKYEVVIRPLPIYAPEESK